MIPAAAHFIWFGTSFPWVHVLALRSACQRGGFERVVLHHEDDLSGSPWWGEVLALPGFEARPLDAVATLAACEPGGAELAALYQRLEQPAARANMVRAAILWQHGGVYLDMDTVTVAPLDGLRAGAAVFCGLEHVVFPASVRRSLSPAVWSRALSQTVARDLCRRRPEGWRRFREAEARFPRAVNNAVLGAEPGHPFVGRLLSEMLAMSPKRQLVRFALGTHLLQDTVAAWPAGPSPEGLVVHPPGAFYPLGPEVSGHWFRQRRAAEGPPPLADVLEAETTVVHWYASVRTRDLVPHIDPSYVRTHADRQLFSALALPFVRDGGSGDDVVLSVTTPSPAA